MAQTGLSVHVY